MHRKRWLSTVAIAVVFVSYPWRPCSSAPPRVSVAERKLVTPQSVHMDEEIPTVELAVEPLRRRPETAADNFPIRCPSPCASQRGERSQTVRRMAVPAYNCRDGGYFVGGGIPVFGDGHCQYHEGTWGWDYGGILFNKRVALHWGHGSRHQGGTGAYKSDGPKLRQE